MLSVCIPVDNGARRSPHHGSDGRLEPETPKASVRFLGLQRLFLRHVRPSFLAAVFVRCSIRFGSSPGKYARKARMASGTNENPLRIKYYG